MNEQKNAINVGSVFCGAGGMDLGFLSAGGFNIKWAVDIDDDALESYRQNLGFAIKMDLRETFPNCAGNQVDILIGGPPCQEFSIAGKRRGVDENHKGYLTLRYLELLKTLKPKMFVMENVKNLATDKFGYEVFEPLLNEMKNAGYTTYPSNLSEARQWVLNTSDYGVPQDRKRIILIGILGDHDLHIKPPTATTPDKKVSLWDAIGNLPITLGEKSPDGFKDHDLQNVGKYQPGRKSVRRKHHVVCDPLRPSPTVTSAHICEHVHPCGNRRLTVREIALLQGFPADFDFSGKLGSKMKQIGNAVPPLFAKEVAQLVREIYWKAFG